MPVLYGWHGCNIGWTLLLGSYLVVWVDKVGALFIIKKNIWTSNWLYKAFELLVLSFSAVWISVLISSTLYLAS